MKRQATSHQRTAADRGKSGSGDRRSASKAPAASKARTTKAAAKSPAKSAARPSRAASKPAKGSAAKGAATSAKRAAAAKAVKAVKAAKPDKGAAATPRTAKGAKGGAGAATPPAVTRPGLRFGSRDRVLSPLALTPPPPPPPTKSPSRGKGITIIEPKRQAMKAALEAEKAARSKGKGAPKLDLANARSVAAVAMSSKADSQGYVIVNGRRVRVISTKAAGPKRKKVKVASAAPPSTPTLPPEQVIQTTKTKLSQADLDHYREILLRHRRELVGRVTGLEDEALRSSGGNLSNMPLHPADIGTDTFDQDFALGMAASDRQLLQEIDEALERIERRTYGVCQMTGKPIPKARLDAKPWAKYTVEAARLVESGAVR